MVLSYVAFVVKFLGKFFLFSAKTSVPNETSVVSKVKKTTFESSWCACFGPKMAIAHMHSMEEQRQKKLWILGRVSSVKIPHQDLSERKKTSFAISPQTGHMQTARTSSCTAEAHLLDLFFRWALDNFELSPAFCQYPRIPNFPVSMFVFCTRAKKLQGCTRKKRTLPLTAQYMQRCRRWSRQTGVNVDEKQGKKGFYLFPGAITLSSWREGTSHLAWLSMGEKIRRLFSHGPHARWGGPRHSKLMLQRGKIVAVWANWTAQKSGAVGAARRVIWGNVSVSTRKQHTSNMFKVHWQDSWRTPEGDLENGEPFAGNWRLFKELWHIMFTACITLLM